MQKFFKNKMKSSQSAYKVGAVLSYITLGVNCLVSIFFTPYMIRHLGESEYGLYQLIGAFAGYLSILDMGMSSAVTKYVSKYYRQNNIVRQENFLSIMLGYYSFISIIVLIAGGVMYGQIGALFAATLSASELIKAKEMFVLLIGNLIFTLFGGIFRGVMNAYECFLQTKGAELARVIMRILMIYGILSAGSDSVGIVVVDTLVNIIFFLYRLSYCFRNLHIHFRFHGIDVKELKEVVFFSFFVFLNLIFDQINWKIDHTILGMKLSTVAVTVYSIGMNFSNYFMNFSVAVKSLFLPKVMNMEVSGASEKDFTDFMIKIGRLQGYLLFYLYFAFLFLGRQFIQLIMGKDYFEAWFSAALVMTGLIVPLLQNAGHPILQAKNKHHVYVIVCLCISVVNAISTWFIVDDYGITGAAFMTMLSFIGGQAIFLTWYYAKKIKINMKLFYYEIWTGNFRPILLIIVVEIIICNYLSVVSWVSFLIQAVVYTILYFFSIYFWGMKDEEKSMLLGKRKKGKKNEA